MTGRHPYWTRCRIIFTHKNYITRVALARKSWSKNKTWIHYLALTRRKEKEEQLARKEKEPGMHFSAGQNKLAKISLERIEKKTRNHKKETSSSPQDIHARRRRRRKRSLLLLSLLIRFSLFPQWQETLISMEQQQQQQQHQTGLNSR